MKLRESFVVALFCFVLTASATMIVNEFKNWKQMDFQFPSVSVRQQATNDGLFVPANVIPIDVAVDYRDSLQNTRTFVTMPRFSPGVPVTLGYVKMSDTAVIPYPSYNWHSSHGRDCEGLTSVFRVAIDECNQMWVLDSGKIGAAQYCQPQLLIFNLRTDKLVQRYRFDKSLYRDNSLFLTPVSRQLIRDLRKSNIQSLQKCLGARCKGSRQVQEGQSLHC